MRIYIPAAVSNPIRIKNCPPSPPCVRFPRQVQSPCRACNSWRDSGRTSHPCYAPFTLKNLKWNRDRSPKLLRSSLWNSRMWCRTNCPINSPLEEDSRPWDWVSVGTKPPVRVPYRMSYPELKELRKELKELLESRQIRPAKSPFGAPCAISKEIRRFRENVLRL